MAENTIPVPAEIIGSIVSAIRRGEMVAFLGAGVNLCDRPPDEAFVPGQHLPSGSELTKCLVKEFGYLEDDIQDLAQAAEIVAVMSGTRPLYKELHKVFDTDCLPTRLHRFLASLPRTLRDKGYPPNIHNQLIVTTNYDDVLERAFQDIKEPYDVVSYEAKKDNEYYGKFIYREYGTGQSVPIKQANTYNAVSHEKRTVILKLHGLIDRAIADHDSYVITEDDYINYLSFGNVSQMIPAGLLRKLKECGTLFLGYGLRDWNVRALLYWIWRQEPLESTSWSIQLRPKPIDKKFWSKNNVEILDIPLGDFVDQLNKHVQEIPKDGGGQS